MTNAYRAAPAQPRALTSPRRAPVLFFGHVLALRAPAASPRRLLWALVAGRLFVLLWRRWVGWRCERGTNVGGTFVVERYERWPRRWLLEATSPPPRPRGAGRAPLASGADVVSAWVRFQW